MMSGPHFGFQVMLENHLCGALANKPLRECSIKNTLAAVRQPGCFFFHSRVSVSVPTTPRFIPRLARGAAPPR